VDRNAEMMDRNIKVVDRNAEMMDRNIKVTERTLEATDRKQGDGKNRQSDG